MLGIGKALSNATSALGVDINDKIFGEIQRTFGGRLRLIITGAAAISRKWSRILKPLASLSISLWPDGMLSARDRQQRPD